MIVSIGILLISSCLFFMRNRDQKPAEAYLQLALGFQMFYFLYRVLFWGGAQSIFMAAAFTTVLFYIRIILLKSPVKPSLIAFSLFTLFIGILSVTPAYKVYYATHLHTGASLKYGYNYLDKYSWFLYTSKENGLAIEANRMAKEALNNAFEAEKWIFGSKSDWQKRLEDHRVKILTGSWKSYE